MAKEIMKALAESGPTDAEMPTLLMSPPRAPEEELLASAWLDTETYKVPPDKSADASRISLSDLKRAAARLFGNSAPLAIVVLGNATELQTQLGYKIELRTNAPETKPAPATTPALPARKP